MKFDPTILAAVAAIGVGFAAFWANPKRSINRIFFSASLHVALWLICLQQAVNGGAQGQSWLRTTTAVGAFIPLHLWFIKEAIMRGAKSWVGAWWRCIGWAVVCTLLASLTATEWFVATGSSRESHGFGWAYYTYVVGVIGVYLALSYQTLRQTRQQTGVNRLELQIVMIGGSIVAGSVIILMALRGLLAQPWLIGLQPIAVILFYSATVVAITASRIFDARQILLVGFEKAVLVLAVAGVAYLVHSVLGTLLPEVIALGGTTAMALWFADIFSSWMDRVLKFYPQATVARQAAFAVTRRETRIESLEKAFLDVLKGWGQSDHALVLSGSDGALRGGGNELPEGSTIVRSLRQLRWVTPERLARERTTPEREELGRFMIEHGLGVVILGEGPALTVVIGVGVAASRRPFTYPQVTQLLELASIIENALERAHFSVKAQRAEQLATVGLLGASLAHEIRNPLVTIKTFVQLLPKHHADPVFREKFFRLIGDEVTRIDRLTEQLLDLAAPRSYTPRLTDLHPVLGASIELVAAKASDKRVQVIADLQAQPDQVFTDAAAAKQVLLNLCFNAIQAVENLEGERWVKVATRNVPTGLEMSVEDSGPGIAREIWPKLFQPFQSTKSTGFGLGLVICSDILAGLNATITVDPQVVGRGATFRVTFPCLPFSS